VSRQIRRVRPEFNAVLDEPWPGCVMPEELRIPACPTCESTGMDNTYLWLYVLTEHILCLALDDAHKSRKEPLHPQLQALAVSDPRLWTRPDAASARELADALTARPLGHRLGYDDLDIRDAVESIIGAAGLGGQWGACGTCQGRGHTADADTVAAHHAWRPEPPPVGEAWQLWGWDDTPMSPAFPTRDELAAWMTRHPCWPGGHTPTLDQTHQLIQKGHMSSFDAKTPNMSHPDGKIT
jgi:hypothetical protein